MIFWLPSFGLASGCVESRAEDSVVLFLFLCGLVSSGAGTLFVRSFLC